MPSSAGRGVQTEPDAGQRRSEPVVQVAAQPAALLLTRLDQPALGGAQRVGEPGGVDRGPGRTGEVGEQRQVPSGERLPVTPFDHEPSDVLPLVAEVQDVSLRTARRAVRPRSPVAVSTAT